MATEQDLLQNMRNRLLNKIRDVENELKELHQAYEALGVAEEKLFSKRAAGELQETTEDKQQRARNLGSLALIRDAINIVGIGEVVSVPEVVKYLRRHGAVGDNRSLYNSSYVALKREAERGGGSVAKDKAKGFIRVR